VAVLDDLRIDRAHFLGYSMGAGLGFGMATHAPDRLLSLVLGEEHPYPEDPLAITERRVRLEQGPEAVVASAEEAHGPAPPGIRAAFLANDVDALLAYLDRPQEDLLPGLLGFAGPCLLYAGDADPRHDGAKRLAGEMPNATFVSLPGLDHWTALTQTEDLLPPIKAFLRSATRLGQEEV